MDATDTPWLTIKQVADLLEEAGHPKVHVNTVRSWSNSGLLPCTKTLGGQRRYLVADVVKLLAERGFTLPAPPAPPVLAVAV